MNPGDVIIHNCPSDRRAVVLSAIADERLTQIDKIRTLNIPFDCADQDTDNFVKLAVLAEEFGEVAKSCLDYSADEATVSDVLAQRLYWELIQVAAVSTAWAESLISETGR